jgi:hypothetical protein
MRRILGWSVFFGGVAGLGYWAQEEHATSIEEMVRAGVSAVDQDGTDGVVVSVSGRDITVEGNVPSEDVRDLILAKMSEVEGRRAIHDALQIVAQN